jgi:cytochrome c biogenesis protein CcmG, thiol:disulfide interchange protein DsbE
MNKTWRNVPIVLFILLCIFLCRGLFLNPRLLPSVQIGKHIPTFRLTQLGTPLSVFTEKDLGHRVVLLNVWASWCSACVEEQIFLMQLAKDGVPLFGINYKDVAKDALHWLKLWGNPYQKIGWDVSGKTAIDLGVYGAPETYVIDKKGIIRYRHAGIMTEEVWVKIIKPLMQDLERDV